MIGKRLGILGGTFDPIHNGHLDLGRAAEAALGLHEVLIVPSNIPPHRGEPLASPFHRFAMAVLAVQARAAWRVSDLELRRNGPSYTVATLERLHADGFDPRDLFFTLGADAFLEIETWRDYPTILDRAHFAVVSRPGLPASGLAGRFPALAPRMAAPTARLTKTAPAIFLIDAPTADVSSTLVRQRAAEALPLSGLVPPLVQEHIERYHLYASARSDAGASHASSGPATGRRHGQD